jgi:hypothetical protein
VERIVGRVGGVVNVKLSLVIVTKSEQKVGFTSNAQAFLKIAML